VPSRCRPQLRVRPASDPRGGRSGQRSRWPRPLVEHGGLREIRSCIVVAPEHGAKTAEEVAHGTVDRGAAVGRQLAGERSEQVKQWSGHFAVPAGDRDVGIGGDRQQPHRVGRQLEAAVGELGEHAVGIFEPTLFTYAIANALSIAACAMSGMSVPICSMTGIRSPVVPRWPSRPGAARRRWRRHRAVRCPCR